jgi:hypothetical protein
MSNSKPSQWPSQLQYIRSSQYHSSVSAAVRLEIESGPSNRSYVPQHRCLVVIRSISCPSSSGTIRAVCRQKNTSQYTHPWLHRYTRLKEIVSWTTNFSTRRNTLRGSSKLGLWSLSLPSSGWYQRGSRRQHDGKWSQIHQRLSWNQGQTQRLILWPKDSHGRVTDEYLEFCSGG